VARIEGLAAKIEEARRLQKAVEADTHRMLLGAYMRITRGARWKSMVEVSPLVRRPVQIDPSEKYYEIGIKSFGKGTFHKPPVDGASLGTKKVFRIETNDLLFNIVFAWEAAVAVAKPQDNGRVGSHRFLTCVPKDGLATSVFLRFHFLTDVGLEQLGKASPGGAGRNRTLGLKALQEIAVPLPAFDEQIWFGSLLAKVESFRHLRSESTVELDALLPSVLDKAFKGEL
jgi:type I restriction enzyme S subunit